MKIAVPVKDSGLEIFQRTGQAPYFAIFSDYEFSHLIKNIIEEHEEEENASLDHVKFHKKQVEALGDIDTVLVLKIGKHIKQALEEKNIKIVEFSNGNYKNAKELVEVYLNSKN